MFNPVFKENIQGRKHPWSCTFAEEVLLSNTKPKIVIQKVKNGLENINHNYQNENQGKSKGSI